MVTEAIIQKEFAEISSKYVKLHEPEKIDNIWQICGEYDVIDPNGYCWDTYSIKIIIPHQFPYVLPTLFETSGKIEQTDKWHNVLGCCLSTEAIMYRELGLPISLVKWLDRFVYDFLANHVIKTRENNYAKGEFSHGTEGIIEGYYEVFTTNDAKIVYQKLRLLCNSTHLGRNAPCFCNSNKKYKNCFLQTPYTHALLGIPVSVIENNYREINNYLLKKNKSH